MRVAGRVVRRGFRGAIAAALAILLTGCATGLESLPLPARQVSGSDSVVIVAIFDNALNLPTKAKVKLNGADIGEVTEISASNFAAYVTMRIDSEVPLYAGSTAQLRSATPLGDVFVAIKPDPNQATDAVRLRSGDTIPLGSTSAAATIEEVLTSASIVVNGGTFRRLVTVLNGAGAAAGGNGAKIAALLRQSNDLLSRLNARSAQLHEVLESTSNLAATLSARQQTLNEVIAAVGPATSVVADTTDQLVQTTETVAGITRQLSRFPSIQGTDTRSLIADLNDLSRATNEINNDPSISMMSTNRTIPIYMKVANSAATHVITDIRQVALGNHPDLNYAGDPASHGPDGTDFHSMVGAFRYSWNLLVDRIYGPKR